jgi:OOP family OmpA-OmpF porin
VTTGRKTLLSTVFVGALAAAPGAVAQGAGFYLGGSLGQATFTEWCDASALTCDDKDSAWKLLGGYRFNQYFAIEATYIDWGKATGSAFSPSLGQNVAISAEQTSMGAAAVGSFPLTPQFSLFGKAGFLLTEQDIRRRAPGVSSTISGDETELHYGVGGRFAFAPNWAVRAEWEKTEKLKVELFSIGVEYRF